MPRPLGRLLKVPKLFFTMRKTISHPTPAPCRTGGLRRSAQVAEGEIPDIPLLAAGRFISIFVDRHRYRIVSPGNHAEM